MRNLGMGKSYLEGAINEEAQALVDDLLAYEGEPVCNPNSFRTAALNVIWQMVASKLEEIIVGIISQHVESVTGAPR